MSKVHPKLTFPDKGLYSPSLFRLKQIQVQPSNPSSKPYYSPNDIIEFNLGGGSNEFIIPESAWLSFEAKVFSQSTLPNTIGFTGASSTGLPRPDYGMNFFQEVDVRLDRTRSVVNLAGEALCRDFMNGRLACAPYASSLDPLDLTVQIANNESAQGSFQQDRYNGDGPLALCGFQSNYRRMRAFAGAFRVNAAAGQEKAKWAIANGGETYRLPLSLFCGLFGPQVSSMIPIGMLSQSSESGVQMRLRLASAAGALVNASDTRGTLKGGAGSGGVGQNSLSGGYGVYSPTITYRVVEILDQSLLASLQAVFNGLVGEQIMLDGQMQSIPRLLTIGYDNWQVYSYVHSANRRTSFLDMSITEPSVKGLMIRLTRTPANDATTKVFDDNSLVVSSLQIKVGSQVFPLTPVQEQLTGGAENVLTDPVTDASYADQRTLIQSTSSTSVANAQLSAWTIEAKQLFSPFADWSYGNSLDPGYAFGVQSGENQWNQGDNDTRWFHPLIFSFENRSQLEDLRGQDPLAASGIDLRGIGTIRVDLSLLEKPPSTDPLRVPTTDVNVTVALLYDSVLRVARNVIDPVYEFTLMT